MKKYYCAFIGMGLLSIFSCNNVEHNADKEMKSATATKQLSAESEPQEEKKT